MKQARCLEGFTLCQTCADPGLAASRRSAVQRANLPGHAREGPAGVCRGWSFGDRGLAVVPDGNQCSGC
jgi:hypothetical protein